MHDKSSCSTNIDSPTAKGSTTLWTYRHVLQVLPVTVTVISGPFIAALYRLTRPADVEIGSFSLAQAARGLLCIIMILPLVVSREWRLLKHRLVRPLLFLGMYAVLTAMASPHPYENLVFAVKMVFVTLVFVNAFQLAERRLSGERWLTICAWILLLTMALCIGSGLITGRTIGAYKSRYATAGIIGQPYVASCLMLSALPVLISLIPRGGSATIGIALLFASLFLTMCRTGLIAAVGAMCGSFLINLCPFRRVSWHRILLPLGVLLLLTRLGLSTPLGADVVERFKELNPSEGTGMGRYVVWRISLEHAFDRPMHSQVLGEGMGGIREVIEQRFGLPIGCHSDWLDFINAFGLCGLVGICWWYVEIARFAWRLRGQQHGLFEGACAAVIILGLVSTGTGGFFEPSWALIYASLGFWAGRAAYPHFDGGASAFARD